MKTRNKRAFITYELVLQTQAEVAKDRLRWIVAKDREACGDGRWVKVSQMERWERYLPHLAPVYRWEPRR